MTATNLLLSFVSLGSIDHCDTDLRLSPGGAVFVASSSRAEEAKAAGKAPRRAEEEEQRIITIFYNGQICACDVTDVQANAIIRTAKGEMENTEAMKERQREISNPSAGSSLPALPAPPLSPALDRRLSMKRSLQRFQENRKTRAHDSSPCSAHQDT